MNASAAKSFHPPWAVTAWVDHRAVYIEMPTKAEPYIKDFPLNEAGFARALHYMQVVHKVKAAPYDLNKQAHSLLKKANGKKQHKVDEAQRERAKGVLRKMGLI